MMWPFTLAQADKDQIEALIKDLKRDIAPELTVKRRQAMSVNKTTRVVERIVQQFKVYDQSRKLGYFARVRYFHHLEWALRDHGYGKEFVDLVLESLLSGVIAHKKSESN